MLEYDHSDFDALARELASLCKKQSALMRFPAHKLRCAPFTRWKRNVLKKKSGTEDKTRGDQPELNRRGRREELSPAGELRRRATDPLEPPLKRPALEPTAELQKVSLKARDLEEEADPRADIKEHN